MRKKMFLVCPDARVEGFIREKFGHDVYFLTALGAVFNFNSVRYAEEVADFISSRQVREIIIVSDISCRFIQAVLEKEKGYGTSSEQVLLHLLIDHYSEVMQHASVNDRKAQLAKLNVEQQAYDLLANSLLFRQITESGISIKGLVTCKVEGKFHKVDLQHAEAYAN